MKAVAHAILSPYAVRVYLYLYMYVEAGVHTILGDPHRSVGLRKATTTT